MKTLILTLLSVAILTACSKDKTLNDRIVGEWSWDSAYVNDEWHDLSDQNIVLTVSEDYISEPYNVNYTLSDDKEMIFSDGNIVMVCFLENSVMRWSFTDGTHLKLTCN